MNYILKTKKGDIPLYTVDGKRVVMNVDIASILGIKLSNLNKAIKKTMKITDKLKYSVNLFFLQGRQADNGANTFGITQDGCLMLNSWYSDGYLKESFYELAKAFDNLEPSESSPNKEPKVKRIPTELEKFFTHRLSKVENFTEFFNAACDLLFDLEADQYRDLIYAVRNYSKDYGDIAILNLTNLIQTEKVLWQLGNDANPKDIKKMALSA